MSKDILSRFKNKAICPSCGCIDENGSFRCLGCGTFHSGAHLVERDAPPVQKVEPVIIDPSAYSLSPKERIVEETFEQSEAVKKWSGGSTDFSIPDEVVAGYGDIVSKPEVIPELEEL
jgi:hypothetical protein